MPDGQKDQNHHRKDHLDVGRRRQSEDAQDEQLNDLTPCEHVDLPLRHPSNVVIGRIRGLLREQQQNALEHLVAVKSRDGQVEEQAVQNSRGNVVQDHAQEGDGHADQHVAKDVGQTRLSHSDHDGPHVAVLHAFLGVGQTLDVQRGMRQHRVQEREPEHAQERVDGADHQQVPVVGVALLQFVFGVVHHGGRNVLVHEKQQAEGKTQPGGADYGAQIQRRKVYKPKVFKSAELRIFISFVTYSYPLISLIVMVRM